MSDEFDEQLVVRGVLSGAEAGVESGFEVKGEGDNKSVVKLESDAVEDEDEEKFRRNLGVPVAGETDFDFPTAFSFAFPFSSAGTMSVCVCLLSASAVESTTSWVCSGSQASRSNCGGDIFFTATPPRLLLLLCCCKYNERGESESEESVREERKRLGLGEFGLGPTTLFDDIAVELFGLNGDRLMAGNVVVGGGVSRPLGLVMAAGVYLGLGGVIGTRGMSESVIPGRGVGLGGGGVEGGGEMVWTGTGTKTGTGVRGLYEGKVSMLEDLESRPVGLNLWLWFFEIEMGKEPDTTGRSMREWVLEGELGIVVGNSSAPDR